MPPTILALLLSEKLRDPLGQAVVPDFRAGADGNLAAELVAKAAADGYTLLLTSTPAEAAKFVRAEFDRWARVIKEAGIMPAQ
jgi:tripartite-type tricarboxylate transporter receptor subunit TctC